MEGILEGLDDVQPSRAKRAVAGHQAWRHTPSLIGVIPLILSEVVTHPVSVLSVQGLWFAGLFVSLLFPVATHILPLCAAQHKLT